MKGKEPFKYLIPVIMKTIIPEGCSGLPPEVKFLHTSQQFPVVPGTHVTVSCDPTLNVELRGDNVITCLDGTLYTFTEKPRCNDAGRSQVGYSRVQVGYK